MKGKHFQHFVKKFEVAESKEFMDVTYILASSVPNANGALIDKDELISAKDTIVNQPLIVVPDYDGLPTGHSLANFPQLDWDAHIVGTHIASELIEENDITHLKTTARIWKLRFPELANVFMNLYQIGSLKFSMESYYSTAEVDGTTRKLNGVRFIGSAVVDVPANEYSYALEVASKKEKKEEKVVNFKEAMEKLKGLDADVFTIVNTELAEYKPYKEKFETAETTINTLKETIKTTNTTLEGVNSELATLKTEKEEAEIAAKQETRYQEISKYIKFEETEVASAKEKYGKLDDETFELLVETAKRNHVEEKEETASKVGFSSDTKLNAKKGFLDGLA